MKKILVVITDNISSINTNHFPDFIEICHVVDSNTQVKALDFRNYSLLFIEAILVENISFVDLKIPYYFIGGNYNNLEQLGTLSLNHLSEQIINISKLFKFLAGVNNYELGDIDSLLANQLEVYQQIKNIHTLVVPLREYSHKGIKIFSKYMVGRSNGGEYFVVDAKKDFLYVFQSTTSSYLINSLLISFSSHLSSKKSSKEFFESFILFLESNLKSDIEIQEIEFLWLKIDCKTLKVEGFQKGDGQLYLNNSEFLINDCNYLSMDTKNKLCFSFTMNRNDQLIWLSSGSVNTIREKLHSFDTEKFLNKNKTDHRSFFEDLFFEFSNQGEDDFLNHDSTCLLVEVGANVIYEV